MIVIPARYGSTRFPGKPLLRETGKYLIEHVVERAWEARGEKEGVVVATDDERIAGAVKSFGGRVVMTSPDHASGTDRIAEVMRREEFAEVEGVVNVQGDEPEIEAGVIRKLIAVMEEEGVEMGTVSAPMEASEVGNPNVVKVVTDMRGDALYFSRAGIPYDRDGGGVGNGAWYRKHLGIYAYRRETLLRLAEMPSCDLERTEKLEQLRALWAGIRIRVIEAERAPHGVDTPEDYAAFVKRYNGGRRAE